MKPFALSLFLLAGCQRSPHHWIDASWFGVDMQRAKQQENQQWAAFAEAYAKHIEAKQ